MNEELEIVNVNELIDEAAFWFVGGMPGREADEDYTKPFYWGLEENEKSAISYKDFHFAVIGRVEQIKRAISITGKSQG